MKPAWYISKESTWICITCNYPWLVFTRSIGGTSYLRNILCLLTLVITFPNEDLIGVLLSDFIRDLSISSVISAIWERFFQSWSNEYLICFNLSQISVNGSGGKGDNSIVECCIIQLCFVSSLKHGLHNCHS